MTAGKTEKHTMLLQKHAEYSSRERKTETGARKTAGELDSAGVFLKVNRFDSSGSAGYDTALAFVNPTRSDSA